MECGGGITDAACNCACILLGVLGFGLLAWRKSASRQQLGEASAPTISKEAFAFASRTFDPGPATPSNMPPLAQWETAECDSDFLSSASVRGEPLQTDATHATVNITQIKMTLQLNINIWGTGLRNATCDRT